jgi:hypothetical protein
VQTEYRVAAIRRIAFATVLATGLSWSASAQTVWSGGQGDVCEVWNDTGVRCIWRRTDRSLASVRVTLTNMTLHYVTAKVGFWRSACGQSGNPSKGETLLLAPGATLTSMAVPDPEPGSACHAIIVTCDDKRCADVLSVSAGASGD